MKMEPRLGDEEGRSVRVGLRGTRAVVWAVPVAFRAELGVTG